MKFKMGHLTKVSSTPQYSVLRHPDGHEIKVSHAHISPSLRASLESMPTGAGNLNKVKGFQDGGEASPYGEEEAIAQQAADQASQAEEPNQPIPQPTPAPTPAPEEAEPEKAQNQDLSNLEKINIPQKVGPQDPFGTQAYMQAYLEGLGETKKGISQEAQAEIAQQRMVVPTLEQQQQQLQDMQSMYQGHLQTLNQERQNVLKDLMPHVDPQTGKTVDPGHIDPNQFWEDKSIPGKIATGIGLIMGGIGGGIMHQENPALKMINAQIDRNITAQRLNVANKYNLLNANQANLQNMTDSIGMTRIMLNDQVAGQLRLAAAKTTDVAARARALQAAGQIDMQSAPIISQMAMRKSLLQGGNSGQLSPEFVIRAVVPENEREPVMKELTEAQDTTKFRDNLISAFDQLDKINTVGGYVKSPIQTQRQVNAIKNPLTAALSKGTAGRFTTADSDMLDALWPMKGDSPQSVATKKRQILNLANEKMNFPRLKSYGINPSTFGRFSPQGSSVFQTLPPQLPGGQ